MDLKIRVFLSLVVLGIVVRDGEGLKACDWPQGVCTYIYDPCPPTFRRCPNYDYSCPVSTNHCCCRTRPPGDTKLLAPPPKAPPARDIVNDPLAGVKACDWARGVCTYIYDPCPPTMTRCPRYDYSCPVPTNHCCCR